MKALIIVLALLCIVAISLFSVVRSADPPHEGVVIRNFYEHRSQFEQLRAMLREDQKLTSVATWGIQTMGSPIAEIPPKGSPSALRFQQYLQLLKAIHANRAGQEDGQYPRICLGMWVSGFTGDTRHVNVCNVTTVPENQVASLDGFYKAPKPRQPVYRHIEKDWYIWANW